MLDSGAAATVIIDSRRSRALQLEMGGKITVSGPGTGPDPVAYIVRDTTVSLGDVSLEKLSVIYLPLDSIPFFEDLDDVYFDGVIGAHFFSRFIVEINYDESEISLTELPTGDYQPKSPADHWQEVALEIDGGVSYLVAQVDAGPEEAVEVKLLVDTGYRGAISVTPETHADLDAPLEYFEDVSEGLSGDVVSHVAMTDLLTVGGYNLNRLPLSYALAGGESESGSNGILGNDVLQHFNLVFDYHNERLLMAPNQNFAMPIDVDRSGLQLRPHVRGAVVRRIATGSAAEASSLKVGDIITEYNGTPVTYKSISELKRTLASELDRVRLCWMSGETRQCADLSLASRFEEGVAVTASGT